MGRQGPYQVEWFTQLPSVPEFSGATLYYPANKAQGFGGVAISPGFFERQENISWWGNYLASNGFAVITLPINRVQFGDDKEPISTEYGSWVRLIHTVLDGDNAQIGADFQRITGIITV